MSTELAPTIYAAQETTFATNITATGLAIISPTSSNVARVTEFMLLFVLIASIVANASMLISLYKFRQARKNTVNVFICNQTVLDLVAAMMFTMKLSLRMSGYTKTRAGPVRMLVCVIIESDALASSAVYASVYGLVIITVERFVKIVYPIVHRNRYRRWMTYAGVVIPWVIGFTTSAVPSLTTVKFISGACFNMVFPSTEVACLARLALFLWRFAIPLIIFIFCYWKILAAVRHSDHAGTSQVAQPSGGTSTSHAAAANSLGNRMKPVSKTQKKVTKTMIGVTSCFIACWLPIQLYLLLMSCDTTVKYNPVMYVVFGMLTSLNLCIDPFIYAAGQYDFTKVRCLNRRDNAVGSALQT